MASTRHRSWVLVGAILALGLALRLYRLGGQSFWIDEARQVRIAAQPMADILRNYSPRADPQLYQQAPLSIIVTHVFLGYGVSPEWAARLPCAIFGVATVLGLYLLARALVRPPAPTVAALLLAMSPLHVWYSQDACWYAQWACLTTFSYLALLHAWKSGRTSAWVSYAALTLLNIYTCILSLGVIGYQFLSMLLLQRADGTGGSRAARRLVVAQVIVAALALPVLAIVATYVRPQAPDPHSLQSRTLLAGPPFTLLAFAGGFSLGPPTSTQHAGSGVLLAFVSPAVFLIVALFLPLVGMGIDRVRKTPAAAVLLPWLCGPIAVAILLAWLTNIPYRVRYALVALPAFYIVVACGLDSLKSPALRRAWLAAIVGCSLWSLGNHYWNPIYAKEDVRGAVSHVRAAAQSSSRVVTVGEVQEAAAFYGGDLQVKPLRRCDPDHSDPADKEESALREALVVWVIRGRDWEERAPHCLEQLSRTHVVVEHTLYPGVDLWRLEHRLPDSAPAADDRG